jgi:hypothetical protein
MCARPAGSRVVTALGACRTVTDVPCLGQERIEYRVDPPAIEIQSHIHEELHGNTETEISEVTGGLGKETPWDRLNP